MTKPFLNCDSGLWDLQEPFRIPDIVTGRKLSCSSIMAFQQIDPTPIAGWMRFVMTRVDSSPTEADGVLVHIHQRGVAKWL